MKLTSILLLLSIVTWAWPGSAAEDPWARARWIQKLARTLHSNEGLTSRELQSLLKQSDQEIIDSFLARPEFGDTSAAAFLYYLGRSQDKIQIKTESGLQYNPMIFAVPQALSSARNVMLGKNLDLFSYRPELILNPMSDPRPVFGELPPEQTRAKILQAILVALDKAAQNFKRVDGTLDKEAGCAGLTGIYTIIDDTVGLMAAGFDFRLEEMVRESWLGALGPDGMGGPFGVLEQSACLREDRSAEFIVKRLQEYRGAFQSLFAQIPAAAPAVPSSILDLLPIKTPASLPPLVTAFTREGFWDRLPNSTSNHNRKRAAFMLQTYFCDGLGEISVEAGSNHANKHASDPACLSCHYKLDPMAGLFRDRGVQGGDFSGLNLLVFDDGGLVRGEAKNLYLKNWQNDRGLWEVGYFIETGKPHPRWQGDSLESFMPFVATAKEAQRCFVKRMAEYFIRSEQTYDSAWLRELTDEYSRNANSGLGFRTLVKRLMTSKAFAAANPDPDFCYDTPANAPGHRPPCKIAGIIEEYCQGCHNSGSPSGRLDLSQWIDLGGGRMGFRHLQNGMQLAPEVSFERIRKRITSEELGPKMPLGRIMTPTDRQLLYEWLSQSTSAQEIQE